MSRPLLHSPADVLRWLLVGLGQGTDPNDVDADGKVKGSWPVYASVEPSSPDDCLTLFDTAAVAEGYVHDGEAQRHHGVQVRVRATTHTIGWGKAEAILVALNEQVANATVAVAGFHYRVECVSAPWVLCIGTDNPKTKRLVFTLNVTAPVEALD